MTPHQELQIIREKARVRRGIKAPPISQFPRIVLIGNWSSGECAGSGRRCSPSGRSTSLLMCQPARFMVIEKSHFLLTVGRTSQKVRPVSGRTKPSGTLDQNRRMSKDYEESAETGKAFVLVVMSCLKARRLVRS